MLTANAKNLYQFCKGYAQMAERNYLEHMAHPVVTVPTNKTFFQPFSLLQHYTGGCKQIRS
jgi:hypothetical protein